VRGAITGDMRPPRLSGSVRRTESPMVPTLLILATLVAPDGHARSDSRSGVARRSGGACIAYIGFHEVWGGSNIWLRDDGAAFAQVAVMTPGQTARELRYTVQIEDARVRRVEKLVRVLNFERLPQPQRLGVPDEVLELIWVEKPTRARAVMAKWQRDVDARFDALHQELQAIEVSAKRGRLLRDGPLARTWHPAGCPSQDTVRHEHAKTWRHLGSSRHAPCKIGKARPGPARRLRGALDSFIAQLPGDRGLSVRQDFFAPVPGILRDLMKR